MSKRKTILENSIENSRKKLVTLTKKRVGIVDERNAELKKVADYFFSTALVKGDEFVVGDDRIEIKRLHPDYTYSKELITLYFRKDKWDDGEFSKINTSFYSTSENSTFELNRMILLGKVAEIIIDFKDDIIANWNKVAKEFGKKELKVSKSIWRIESDIRNAEEMIAGLEKEDLNIKLFGKGIKFGLLGDEKAYCLPSLRARWDYEINKVTSIRATRKTYSGKSYDVEGTFAIERWDSDKNEYYTEDSPFKCKSVRAVNVDNLVYWNRNRIKE